MSDDEAQPYDIPAVWGQSDELDNEILDDLLDGNSAILALDVPKAATNYFKRTGNPIVHFEAYRNLCDLVNSSFDKKLALERKDLEGLLITMSGWAKPVDNAQEHRIKSMSDSDTEDESIPTDDGTGDDLQRSRSQETPMSPRLMSPTGSVGGGPRPFPGPSYPLSPERKHPPRAKTLSGGLKAMDSPLADRLRSEASVPHYGNMGFAKPMSMNHRRRISRDASGQSADDMGHQEVLVAARFKRSQSVSSIPRHERPDSPSVDNSSFLLKSPPGQLEPDDSLEDIHSACDNTIQTQKAELNSIRRKLNAMVDRLDVQRQRHVSDLKGVGEKNEIALGEMQQKYDEVMEKLHSVSKQLSEAQKHDRATSHLVAEYEVQIERYRVDMNVLKRNYDDTVKRCQKSIDECDEMREQLAIKEAELSTLNENNAFSLRTFRTQVFKLQETIDAQAPLIEEGDAVKKRLEESEQRNEELMEEVKLLRKDAERASSPTADLVDAPASIGRTSLGSELFGKAQQMREKTIFHEVPVVCKEPHINPQDVLDGAHPHCGALPILGDDEEYNELVRHLGVRCTVLEKEFAQHPEKVRPKRAKTVTGKRTSEERPGMSPRRLSAYGAAGAMFAVGMFVGGAWATAAALNREATWHLGVNSIAYAYSAHGQHLSPAATYGSAFFNMMEGLIREQGPYFVPT